MVLIGIFQILLDININLIKEWSIGNIPKYKVKLFQNINFENIIIKK